MEENVVASAGARNSMNTNEMIKVIRDAGEICDFAIRRIIF